MRRLLNISENVKQNASVINNYDIWITLKYDNSLRDFKMSVYTIR